MCQFSPQPWKCKVFRMQGICTIFRKIFPNLKFGEKRRKGVVPFRIFQKSKVVALRKKLGFRLQIQKKTLGIDWNLKVSETAFIFVFTLPCAFDVSFCFEITTGAQFYFFFASFYESVRKKLSNFLSLQMMYVSRKTESFTFCLKYSLQFSKLILKYFFH